MNPHAADPLARRLAALPDAPLDGRAVANVGRRARLAFLEDHGVAFTLVRAWSGAVLPAVLVGCAVFYAWGSVQFIERVYLAHG